MDKRQRVDDGECLSAYEIERNTNIKRNEKRLEELGLLLRPAPQAVKRKAPRKEHMERNLRYQPPRAARPAIGDLCESGIVDGETRDNKRQRFVEGEDDRHDKRQRVGEAGDDRDDGTDTNHLPSSAPKNVADMEAVLAADSLELPSTEGMPWELIPTNDGILSMDKRYVLYGDLPRSLVDFLEPEIAKIFKPKLSAKKGVNRYWSVYPAAGANYVPGCFLGWQPRWIDSPNSTSLGKVFDSKLGAAMVVAANLDHRLRTRNAVRGWTMDMIARGDHAVLGWIEELQSE